MIRFLALFLAALPSCARIPRETPAPARTIRSGEASGGEMMVFLPGRWSRVEEFQRKGFFEITRKRWPDARLVAVDLHLDYHKDQSVARSLQEDFIRPARRSGGKRVRIVSILMGGLGALIYDAEYLKNE
jgi:hypothetical protein